MSLTFEGGDNNNNNKKGGFNVCVLKATFTTATHQNSHY